MWHGIQKNERLKIERGLFEEVMDAIVDGKTIVVLKIGKDRFPNQRIFVVNIDDYAFLIRSSKKKKNL